MKGLQNVDNRRTVTTVSNTPLRKEWQGVGNPERWLDGIVNSGDV